MPGKVVSLSSVKKTSGAALPADPKPKPKKGSGPLKSSVKATLRLSDMDSKVVSLSSIKSTCLAPSGPPATAEAKAKPKKGSGPLKSSVKTNYISDDADAFLNSAFFGRIVNNTKNYNTKVVNKIKEEDFDEVQFEEEERQREQEEMESRRKRDEERTIAQAARISRKHEKKARKRQSGKPAPSAKPVTTKAVNVAMEFTEDRTPQEAEPPKAPSQPPAAASSRNSISAALLEKRQKSRDEGMSMLHEVAVTYNLRVLFIEDDDPLYGGSPAGLLFKSSDALDDLDLVAPEGPVEPPSPEIPVESPEEMSQEVSVPEPSPPKVAKTTKKKKSKKPQTIVLTSVPVEDPVVARVSARDRLVLSDPAQGSGRKSAKDRLQHSKSTIPVAKGDLRERIRNKGVKRSAEEEDIPKKKVKGNRPPGSRMFAVALSGATN